MRYGFRTLTGVALVSLSLATGVEAGPPAELSDLCNAANAPDLDSRYTGMELGSDPGENFAIGETLTVSATNPGGLEAIVIMVDDAEVLIDQTGPDFTLTHTYTTSPNTANWIAIIGVIEFGDADWVVSCERSLPAITPFWVRLNDPPAGTSVTASVPVNLSMPSTETITVDYTTVNDRPAAEATSGEDFEPTSGTLTFEPGETTAYVDIEVLGDDVAEDPLYGGEWGVVQFSNVSSNAVLDTAPFFGAGLFIINDDS